MHSKGLGNQIRNRRKVLGITQEQLSDLSGVAARTLKDIELGRGNPTLETINRLMRVLGLVLKIEVGKE